MNVAYCSLLLPEEKKLAERAKKRLPGISLHKVTSAMIQGLDANLDSPVSVFNIINTLNYPNFPELIFPTEQWHHRENADDWHIGYINLFGIKYITQEAGLYKKLCKWVESKGTEPCMICVHHIFYPAMKAAYRVRQKYGDRVKICLNTGDMNGQYGLAPQFKPNLKQKITRRMEKRIDDMAKEFDCFIFVTKYMAEGFGVADKPFTVLECTYADPPYAVTQAAEESEDKIIFYAGAIREEYGIPHLLRAFSMIENPHYRLWLAGGGNAEPLVKEYARKDPRIEFLGFITPQEVNQRQNQATALISPRTSELEFVKYSFASKTLDSLASGKPYIAHRLPCDPPEYANYIQYAADETDRALKDQILKVCELPSRQRDEIGKRAREFVLSEKNPEVMCRRVIRMWQEQLG